MQARAEDFSRRHAKSFQQRRLARLDKDKSRRNKQRGGLPEHQPAEGFFQEAIEPGLGNFEAKLIIERLGRRRDQAFGLAQQADQPAFVQRPIDFSFDARAVDFED